MLRSTRRFFLLAAPAIVAAPSLMRVSTMPSKLELEANTLGQSNMRKAYASDAHIVTPSRLEIGQQFTITGAQPGWVNGDFMVTGGGHGHYDICRV